MFTRMYERTSQLQGNRNFDGEKLIFIFTSVLLVKIACSTKERIRKQSSKDVIVQKNPENHNGTV